MNPHHPHHSSTYSSVYSGGPAPPPPPSGSHGSVVPPGMPSTLASSSASHHHIHHSQPPPPPSHHPHHLSRVPPPPPSQANGIPQPPSGPSPRVMHGSAVSHADGPAGMPPPPPRTASASSHHHIHSHGSAPYEMSGPGQMGVLQKLAHSNEQAWISIGSAAESMEDYERAIAAYESALRHHPYSVPAMSAIAGVHRTLDRFEKVSDPSFSFASLTYHPRRLWITFNAYSTLFLRTERRGGQWDIAI